MLFFARTRHNYDSYVDWWTLVEHSGFPSVFVDQIQLDNPDHIYVVSPMNGEFTAHLDWAIPKHCRIIHWNLERPGDKSLAEFIADNQRLVGAGMVDEVVVSDRRLAHDTGFRYLPLGGHPALGRPGTELKVYDFTHLMCYSYNRSKTGLFNYIKPLTTFNEFSIGPNGWGELRDYVLRRTRFMLNVHQDTYLYMEPVRFLLATMYGLPIVTQECYDPYPYEVVEFPLGYMHNVMQQAMSIYPYLLERAERQRELMTTELSFRRVVEEALL